MNVKCGVGVRSSEQENGESRPGRLTHRGERRDRREHAEGPDNRIERQPLRVLCDLCVLRGE